MKGLFKRWRKEEQYGHILLVNEIMPLYAGTPAITNKKFCKVNSVIDNLAEGLVINGLSKETSKFFYRKERLLTQNGEPIETNDAKLSKIIQNDRFSKEGFRKGQFYTFSGLGFLENINCEEIVISVTDEYVIFKDANGKVWFRSYRELKKLKDFNKVMLETF